MTRGRPKGAGMRWNDDLLAGAWAAITLIVEKENTSILEATRRLANRGFIQADGRRFWDSRSDLPARNWPVEWIRQKFSRGHARRSEPALSFRRAYYDAEARRSRDPDFREKCDSQLAFSKRRAANPNWYEELKARLDRDSDS